MNAAVTKVQRLVSNNKAISAAVTAFGGVLAADAASFIATGNWNVSETRTAAGAFLLALLTGGVTWLTRAGDAVVELPPQQPDNVVQTPTPQKAA